MEGNWTLICQVSDVYAATTTAERGVEVDAVVLDAAVAIDVLSRVADAQVTKD